MFDKEMLSTNITLVPVGPVPVEALSWMVDRLAEITGQDVVVGEAVPLPSAGHNPRRRQYRGDALRGIEDFIRRDRRCRTNARSRGTNMTNYSVWLRAATCRRALKRRRICKGSAPTTPYT